MISYSQNQEDVVISRLCSIIDKGVYVDVGAGHPILENVTYGLHLRGWRGINVEPMRSEYEMLCQVRPEDVNIRAAAGSEVGTVTLFEAPMQNRGATTSDTQALERYRSEGQEFVPFDVPVVRVGDLLTQSTLGEIHVMKIDVEGAERSVILGADLSEHRPWVLVIEATRPNSRELSSTEWDDLVLGAGYVEVLFDGLNKFFVRADLDDVAVMLSSPANVFDQWESAETAQLRDELKKVVADARHDRESLEQEIGSLKLREIRLESLLFRSMGWLPDRERRKLSQEG